MHPRGKLDLSNERQSVAWSRHAVGLRKAEPEVWSFHLPAHSFRKFREELPNNVVWGIPVEIAPLEKLLANHSTFIYVKEAGMSHPFVHAFRFRVEDLEGSNHLRVRIGQEWKVDLVTIGKVLEDLVAIVTDGRQLDAALLETLFRILQLDQLRFAERSPISGAEE
jgi:hypothetical protein